MIYHGSIKTSAIFAWLEYVWLTFWQRQNAEREAEWVIDHKFGIFIYKLIFVVFAWIGARVRLVWASCKAQIVRGPLIIDL